MFLFSSTIIVAERKGFGFSVDMNKLTYIPLNDS